MNMIRRRSVAKCKGLAETGGTGGKLEDAKFAEISHDQIHEARLIRGAEKQEPGIVRRALSFRGLTARSISRAIGASASLSYALLLAQPSDRNRIVL